MSTDSQYSSRMVQNNTLPLELKIQQGHEKGFIHDLTVSPDGKFLASCSNDGTIILWEISSGRVIRTFKGHFSLDINFSSDGKYLTSAGNKKVTIWELESGKIFKTFNINGFVIKKSIHISPDNKFVSYGAKNVLKIWDIKKVKVIKTLKPIDKQMMGITAVDFSIDNKIVITGNYFSLNIWDFERGEIIGQKKGFKKAIRSVAISPDKKFVLTGLSDGTVEMWNIKNMEKVQNFKVHQNHESTTGISSFITSGVSGVTFSPDGRLVLSGSNDGSVRLWDVSTGKILIKKTMDRTSGKPFIGLALSNNGQYIFYADRAIRQLQINSGYIVKSFEGFSPSIRKIHYLADKQFAVSLSNSHRLKLWDLTKGRVIKTYKKLSGEISKNAFKISPNNKFLISASGDHTLKLYDLKNENPIYTFKGHSDTIKFVDFSPDGKLILSGSKDKSVKIWDVNSRRLNRTIKGVRFSDEGIYYNDTVLFVGFSPKSDSLFLRTSQFTKIISIKTDKTNLPYNFFFKDILPIAGGYSPSGKYFLFSKRNDENIFVLNIRKNGLVKKLPILKNFFRAPLITPNDKYLIYWSKNGSIERLDLSTMEHSGQLRFSNQQIKKITFTPNGKYLLTVSSDNNLKLWDYNNMKLKWEVNTKESSFLDFLSSSNSQRFWSVSKNGDFFLWDVMSDKPIRSFKMETLELDGEIISISDKYFLQISKNNFIKYWSAKTGQFLAIAASGDQRNWAVVTQDGRFDKSQITNGLFYVQGLNTFNLDQYFDEFYSPGLLTEVLKSGKVGKENLLVKLQQEYPAPDIEIINPKPADIRGLSIGSGHNLNTEKSTIQVKIKVTSLGGGVGQVSLYHNNKSLANAQIRGLGVSGQIDCVNTVGKKGNPALPRGESQVYCFNVQLLPGKNTLKAVAKSLKNIESSPWELIIDYKEKKAIDKPDAYFMIVGINKYKNKKYNLNYGKPDAEAIKAVLLKKGKNLFNKIHLSEIYDAKVTKQSITNTLEQIISKANPRDLFLFYYAGHGVMVDNEQGKPHFYIAPHDVTGLYREEQIWERGVSAKQLTEYTKRIQARKQLLIMDACQSGGMEDVFALRGAAEEKALKQLSRSSGIFLLASTQSEQYAYEFDKLGHGVFTYAILKGLAGEAEGSNEDGKITVRELSAYIDDKVPELTELYRGEAQWPSIYGKGQDFPILLR